MSYYNRDGSPVEMMKWASGFETQNRQVALTKNGDITISTVYVGINMQFGEGPPLIFETMIFGGSLDQDTWRYTTEEEARAGHAAAVEAVKVAQNG